MATTGLSAGFSSTFEAIGLPTKTRTGVRRHAANATSLGRLLWPSLLAFSLSFLSELFVLRLTGSVHRFAVLWPVTGLQLGLLLSRGRLRWRQAALFMLSSAAGVILVGMVIGMPRLLGCEIAAFTILESLLGLWILRSHIRSYSDLKRGENLSRLGSAVFLVPLISASLGAQPIATFLHTSMARTFCQGLLANSLGIALLLPATLWVLRRKGRDWTQLRSLPALASVGVFSTVAVGIFSQHLMPTLFFVFPPMVLVTSIAGLEGAMVSSLLLTAIGWIATVHGHGPICFMQGMSNDDQLLLLQIFLCTFLASALPIGALADARRAANLKLHRLTLEDPLTGLGNRRSFDAVLDQDLRRSQETGRPLSVLMLDVDHFKRLNDTYGHAEGDRVLRELGDLLRRTVRSGDRVCRHGGEEFAIMLPETTVEQALCLAERICHVVREHAWTICGVTVSVGVAASTQETSNSISLATEADRALYAAKRAGRDQALLSNAIAS